MFVGAITLELFLPECQSLKAKRQILKSIIDKVRTKFNVSIAEVDNQDLWQRATLGITYVCESNYQTQAVLKKVQAFIEGLNKAEVIDYKFNYYSPE